VRYFAKKGAFKSWLVAGMLALLGAFPVLAVSAPPPDGTGQVADLPYWHDIQIGSFSGPVLDQEHLVDVQTVDGSLHTPDSPEAPPAYKPYRKPQLKYEVGGTLTVAGHAPLVRARLIVEKPNKRKKTKPVKLYSIVGENHDDALEDGRATYATFRLPGKRKIGKATTLKIVVAYRGGYGVHRVGFKFVQGGKGKHERTTSKTSRAANRCSGRCP